jgi:glutamate/tyrosine decarboxylase-like PLP-dependent enzyme
VSVVRVFCTKGRMREVEGRCRSENSARLIPRRASAAPASTLGRSGVAEMIDRSIGQTQRLAAILREAGFDVANRVVLNQILVRGATDDETIAIRSAAVASGETWFGPTIWRDHQAFRLRVSSWRTEDDDIDALAALLIKVRSGG